jgi:hypothetical protein
MSSPGNFIPRPVEPGEASCIAGDSRLSRSPLRVVTAVTVIGAQGSGQALNSAMMVSIRNVEDDVCLSAKKREGGKKRGTLIELSS